MPIRISSYEKISDALIRIDEIFQKVKEEGKTEDLAYLSAEQRKFYKAFSVYWVREANRKFLSNYIGKLIVQALQRKTANGAK